MKTPFLKSSRFYFPFLALAYALTACEVKTDEEVKPARSYTRNTQTFTAAAVPKTTFGNRTFFEFTNKDGSYDVKHALWTYKNGIETEGIITPKTFPASLVCDSIKLVYTISDAGTVKQTEVLGKIGETILLSTKEGKTSIKFDLKTSSDKMVGEIGE